MANLNIPANDQNACYKTLNSILFRNIGNYFLVMMKTSGPKNILGRILIAIDDVTITEGSCKK